MPRNSVWVSLLGEESTWAQGQGRRPHEDGAEIGVMLSQAQESQEPPEARRDKKSSSPGAFGGHMHDLADTLTSSLAV
jgi:hypothetical protein